MLDRVVEWALTGTMSLPGWAVVAGLAAIIATLAVLRMRAGFDGRGAAWAQAALVAVAILAGWWLLDHFARRDAAADERAFEARALELATRALAPGSALACLDAIAGDAVEDACEKTVFATPEATAAAVSYVAAQLSLLSWAGERARRRSPGAGPSSPRSSTLSARTAQLRRAIEADRFGIAAHVLALRDGCTVDRCGAFALLQDTRRISANLVERPFDAQVKRYAAAWPAAGTKPVASNVAPAVPVPPAAAATKPPGNLYFPSASSIPPVNIMTAEPAPAPPHDTTGTGETGSAPRKGAPAATQARPPASSSPAPARSAPTPLSPPQQ
jgi:hypothetical protein